MDVAVVVGVVSVNVVVVFRLGVVVVVVCVTGLCGVTVVGVADAVACEFDWDVVVNGLCVVGGVSVMIRCCVVS